MAIRERLISAKHLRGCRLWENSTEQLLFQGSGLTVSAVAQRAAILGRCDDLTPGEEEYLAALRKTLVEEWERNQGGSYG